MGFVDGYMESRSTLKHDPVRGESDDTSLILHRAYHWHQCVTHQHDYSTRPILTTYFLSTSTKAIKSSVLAHKVGHIGNIDPVSTVRKAIARWSIMEVSISLPSTPFTFLPSTS